EPARRLENAGLESPREKGDSPCKMPRQISISIGSATRSPSCPLTSTPPPPLLDLIREFDARGGWSNGFRSCAAWLSWRVGFAPGPPVSTSAWPAPSARSRSCPGLRARRALVLQGPARSRRRYGAPCSIATTDVASPAAACISGRLTTSVTGQGGPTKLSNLALLCRRHHRAVHEEGFQVERQLDGALHFKRPDGSIIPDVPLPSNLPADPVGAMRARHEQNGLALYARTAIPVWRGEPPDVGYAIVVLHPRALKRKDRPPEMPPR